MSSRPLFATCSVDGIKYRGEFIRNRPVNLSLCTTIDKGKYAWYPDNTGKPSIVFNGCDCTWAYDDEALRDLDFEKISNNESPRSTVSNDAPVQAAGEVFFQPERDVNKCPRCGGGIAWNTQQVLTSDPPQYQGQCIRCSRLTTAPCSEVRG